MSGTALATACLGLLAVGHSVLGEKALIGPLMTAPLPTFSMPETFARRTLRFAWHLTSLAWLALAWALWSTDDAAPAVAALLLVSGLITFVATRGAHFAWALFIAGGCGAAHVVVPVGAGSNVAAVSAAVVLAVVAVIHVGWGIGLTQGLRAAVPEVDGRPLFQPSRAAALVVAGALAVAAALILSLAGVAPAIPAGRVVGGAAVVVFAARTIGDGRTVGVFKRVRGTAFSHWDTQLFTPLCFSLGAAFAWVLSST